VVAEPLRRSVRLRCSLAHAFDTFTARVDLWWPSGHRRHADSRLYLETSAGGRFFERSIDGQEAKLGDVLSCEPPHRISYTWYPGAIEKPTRVDITFVQDGEETIVDVVHSEGDSALGDAWPKRVELFARAWGHVLAGLVAYAGGAQEGSGRSE
jgi:uncharacterized protein YndB with AHSA1/START domain